jgi:sulfur carrier protein ThiS
MPVISLPDGLRRYAGGNPSFEVPGGTVAEALAAAFRVYPDLRLRLVDEAGRVHPYLVVFRNDAELGRDGLAETALGPGDRLTLLEAIGGG